MKRYYLSYNEITKEYYLDYGSFDSQRNFLGHLNQENLIKGLKEIFPLHKKVILITEKSLDSDIQKYLLESFGKTRVIVEFVKDIRKAVNPNFK